MGAIEKLAIGSSKTTGVFIVLTSAVSKSKQQRKTKNTVKLAMATITLYNTVLMLLLIAALSTCQGNAFEA